MMTAMDDAQLSDVHGQAWVLTVGENEFRFKSLDERDIDAKVADFIEGHPRIVNAARRGASFVVPRILGRLADRADVDLGEISFGYVPTPPATP